MVVSSSLNRHPTFSAAAIASSAHCLRLIRAEEVRRTAGADKRLFLERKLRPRLGILGNESSANEKEHVYSSKVSVTKLTLTSEKSRNILWIFFSARRDRVFRAPQ